MSLHSVHVSRFSPNRPAYRGDPDLKIVHAALSVFVLAHLISRYPFLQIAGVVLLLWSRGGLDRLQLPPVMRKVGRSIRSAFQSPACLAALICEWASPSDISILCAERWPLDSTAQSARVIRHAERQGKADIPRLSLAPRELGRSTMLIVNYVAAGLDRVIASALTVVRTRPTNYILPVLYCG